MAVEQHGSLETSGGVEDGSTSEKADEFPISVETRTRSPLKEEMRSSSKEPPKSPNVANIPRIPSPPPEIVNEVLKMSKARRSALSRYPAPMVKMGTGNPIRGKIGTTTIPSVYYESPIRREKTITWDQAMAARPPLRIDMDGPTPFTYSPLNKPLNETNAPSHSFGRKCWPEKSTKEGSRTSWAKTWTQNPYVFTQKVDFFSDRKWPTPTSYRIKPMLGPRQCSSLEYPSFTIGERRSTLNVGRPRAVTEPAPWDYERHRADRLVLKTSSSFSMTPRRTKHLFAQGEKTPGPATYSPKYSQTLKVAPSFTVCGIRKAKSQQLGPFSSL